MALSDILIISSIIAGLVSIPLLATGPLSDSIPTGKLVLGTDQDDDVEATPSKMTKTFSSEKFEKVYETPFGKFTVMISAGEVFQELSKPGKVTTVTEDTEETTWKITTQDYQLEIVRTPNSVTQTCTTPDGELIKVKETGEVTESFQGMNQEQVIEVCSQAEQDLQEEVEKMGQIVEESEIPSTETSGAGTKIYINEFMADPENESQEWIELFNPTDSDVDLSGWTIEDDSGSEESLDGKNITANGYLLLNKSDDDFDFGLANTKDIIILRDSGNIVDQIAYGSYNDGNIDDNAPDAPEESSAARIPDGSNSWEVDDTPTPGESND